MKYVNKFVWLAVLFAGSSSAAELALNVEIPRLNVAEYHKPYVGIWIENSRRQATQVAVWYDVEMANQEGEEWLKDMRQWWRRGGRALELPVDGLSGATRGPGVHQLQTELTDAIKNLPEGEYTLRIEAAREVGGRELLSLTFSLPLETNEFPIQARGNSELGLATLNLSE
ncbi:MULTISPECIES: DUF2271 domain-containing protein [Gammaproteobacteria]|uniref:DUF2271 domain-containing protein n=1 Tax=Gammaproteobacteria TaxID=1236 RepID=UPI000DD09EDF|nr:MULTISPECIES: DUF2271 domain-containing protein [Gammaproteobacteria]RTE85935.1 DUF2271 domain-containing protein [Aliidiomarina sp. B3213]TCZ90066.1 DUF2271 domain-containing protein [Lysobacter sp. N42]